MRNSPRCMLILDFDGVLAHTEPVHFASWNATFEEFAGVQKSGDHAQLVGLTLNEIFAHWLPDGELTPAQKTELLKRKTARYFDIAAQQLTLTEGSIELIHQARDRGWYVGIASRALRLRLLKTLEIIGLPATIDVIMGSEDVVDAQTDRKIHTRAAHVFGIEPARCIVIEDSASGVRDARASGIPAVIGLTTSLTSEALYSAGAQHVIDHMSAFPTSIFADIEGKT